MTDDQIAVSLSIICLVLILLLMPRSSDGFKIHIVYFAIYTVFSYVVMYFCDDDLKFLAWVLLVILTLIHIGLLLLYYLYLLVTFVWRKYLRDHHLFKPNK